MSIQIGDTVEIIFSQKIGRVVRYHDIEVAVVTVAGTEIPVFVKFLKKIGDTTPRDIAHKSSSFSSKQQTNKPLSPNLPTFPNDREADRGIKVLLQAFYTSENIIDYFLVHLWNDTGYPITFSYSFALKKKKQFSFKKTLGRRERILLNTFALDDLNERPQLDFSFDLLQKMPTQFAQSFTKMLQPKAKLLRKAPVLLPKTGIKDPVYVLELYKKLPLTSKTNKKPIKTWQATPNPHGSKKVIIQKQEYTNDSKVVLHIQKREVDLHIEQLLPSYKHLPKRQILQTQLQHFEKHLQQAIQRKEPSMIVIHGLGKGKLKQELVKILRTYPQVYNFKNEYDPRFGFGATEIFFDHARSND